MREIRTWRGCAWPGRTSPNARVAAGAIRPSCRVARAHAPGGPRCGPVGYKKRNGRLRSGGDGRRLNDAGKRSRELAIGQELKVRRAARELEQGRQRPSPARSAASRRPRRCFSGRGLRAHAPGGLRDFSSIEAKSCSCFKSHLFTCPKMSQNRTDFDGIRSLFDHLWN